METNFYNSFRNTIRILLGRIEHRQVRKELEDIINKQDLIYQEKLSMVDEKIRELANEHINFITYDSPALEKLHNVTTCLINTDSECKNDKYCLLDNDSCKLLIPKINLINQSNNEEIYYGKISDEVIRYSRIRHFIFEPQAFLSF